jgi:subtilisin family serine protease
MTSKWSSSKKKSKSKSPKGSQVIHKGVKMVQAPKVWKAGYKGAGVKVCVIDTGIDPLHVDFVTDNLSGFEEGHIEWSRDTFGHGTAVASVIAAADNDIGIVGVAPEAKIYTVRIMGSRTFVWASGLFMAGYECLLVRAKIVNMSWGSTFHIEMEEPAFEWLYNQGMLLVASSGNTKSNKSFYPASFINVLSISAVDHKKNHAIFFTHNHMVDLTASWG